MQTKNALKLMMTLSLALAAGQALAQELPQEATEARQELTEEQRREALRVCFDQPQSFQRRPGDFARPGKYESRVN